MPICQNFLTSHVCVSRVFLKQNNGICVLGKPMEMLLRTNLPSVNCHLRRSEQLGDGQQENVDNNTNVWPTATDREKSC